MFKRLVSSDQKVQIAQISEGGTDTREMFNPLLKRLSTHSLNRKLNAKLARSKTVGRKPDFCETAAKHLNHQKQPDCKCEMFSKSFICYLTNHPLLL